MKKNISTLLKSPGNLIFCGAHTQFNNLGDLIINRILLEKLGRYGTVVIRDEGIPAWYYGQLGLTTQQRASDYKWKFNYLILFAALRSRFSSKRRRVYLVETPGHRYGEMTRKWLKPFSLALLHYFIFRLAGVRICALGVSIGPFDKTLEIIEWCRNRLLFFYSVRDSLSATYAKQIGINRAARFPDLAWLLETHAANPDRQTDTRSGAQANKSSLRKDDYVIFSFRAQTHNLADSSTHPQEYQQQLFRSLDAIASLVSQTWSKKLIISYQVEMDQPFCQQLAERYAASHQAIFVKEQVDLDSMREIYGNAFIVFSNRLHVLMLAMALGAIPIAVVDTANHSKITGIFQDADLHRLVVDVGAGEMDLAAVSEIAENAAAVRGELADGYAKNRAEGNALLRQLFTR